ncbi:hypothetical protein BV22DRAFT_1135233 [Leucogyrophana mollusca]|uniref:Uncharacterized protein n=1 Tax=Leucogyrophana mollusca TaxID=85980 RepID=A0ACB8AWL6_9AGAM|nr:hypothetical protein BV22DRAFT_1135233 [Leucogyrophana mollusca]
MARTPSTKAKVTRAKLSAGQKRERHEKRVALADAINTARDSYVQEAQDIAQAHRRSLKWTRSQLFLKSRMLQQRRRVNPWNAFLMAKLREENEGRSSGERVKLTQFITNNRDKLLRAYAKLTPADKRVLELDVLAARQAKLKATRANPKALRHDVNATFTSMDREWRASCARTGAEGFYIAVRGSIEDFAEPKIFFTEKAEKFAKAVLDLEPRNLALKLESWVISGLNVPSTSNRQRPLNKLVSECRTHIQEEFECILIKKKKFGNYKMNYDNYEKKIVEAHGVALVGWPSGRVRNPGRLGGRAAAEQLLNALVNEKCYWVILSDEELEQRKVDNKVRQARGEQVYKARKAKGVSAKAHKSADNIGDADDESSDDE